MHSFTEGEPSNEDYERPISQENIDVSSSLSNYSGSDSLDEEPFGSGGSEADLDFQATNSSSPLSVESEEDILQNKVLSKRRLVKFPSDAEKKSRKRKKNSQRMAENKSETS